MTDAINISLFVAMHSMEDNSLGRDKILQKKYKVKDCDLATM